MKIIITFFFFFCSVLVFVQQVAAQQKLVPNDNATRTIEAGKSDSFSLALNDGDYVTASLEQNGRVDTTIEGPDGAVFDLSGTRFKLSAPVPAGPALARVRPERVTIAAATAVGIRAKVRTRVFQGAHWLFQLDTSAGVAVVLAPNDGASMPREGEDVTLSWKPADMSVSAGAAA